MKEWIIKHPILTFLLADSAIGGIVSIAGMVIKAIGKENKDNERTGDIQ